MSNSPIFAQCWQSVSAGGSHTLALKPDGTLWGWGVESSVPVQIGTESNWKSVFAGAGSSFAIKTDGSLWAWGENSFGQMGNGSYGNVLKTPTRIGTATDWKAISPSYGFTVAVKTDGTLWAWGTLFSFEFGAFIASPFPVRVGSDTNWAFVTAGFNHIMALKTDGSLWGWGDNYRGQLGDGTLFSQPTPKRIGTEANWRTISAGTNFTIAIKSDGTLWSWGSNDVGQLGVGTFDNKPSPTRVGTESNWRSISTGYDNAVALKTNGTLWAWGQMIGRLQIAENISNSPQQLTGNSDWQSIESGDWHSFATKTDGSFWAWGKGTSGQLGLGSSLNFSEPERLTPSIPTAKSTQALCPQATIADLLVAGTAVKWYLNPTGGGPLATTLPLVNGTSYYASQTKSSCESVARTKVTVVLNPQPTPAPTGASIQVFCGPSVVSNLSASGVEIKWYLVPTGGTPVAAHEALINGQRYYASQMVGDCESAVRLQVSVTVNITPPPSASANQVFCNAAVISNLAAVGSNLKWYAVPEGGAPLPSDLPLSNATSYYVSQTLNACESPRRAVNVQINSTPPPSGEITQYFCNSGTVAGLVAQGSTVKWYASETGGTPLSANTSLVGGNSYYGTQTISSCESAVRLRVNVIINTAPTPPPTGAAVQSVCSGSTLASLLVTGTGIKWYSNSSGGIPLHSDIRLLSGGKYYASQTINTCESTSRLEVSVSFNPVAMPIRFGAYSWKSISAGYDHTLAVMNDGTLWAWGSNQYGQLGDGTNASKNGPTLVDNDNKWESVFAGASSSIALKQDGTLWFWGINFPTQILVPTQVGSDKDWRVASTSGTHTLAIKYDGTLWSWGSNYYGQLGDGTRVTRNAPTQIGTDNDWDQVSAGGGQSLAIKKNKTLWTWGKIGVSTSDGVTIPTELDFYSGWESVSAGFNHVLGIRSDGTLWAWGSNEWGQLGSRNPINSESSPSKIGDDNDWAMVSSGLFHSTAMKKDGSIWAWGQNVRGQSGNEAGNEFREPHRIGLSYEWRIISAGGYHTMALSQDENLWGWGYNYHGELGDETHFQSNIPKKIEGPQQRFCPGAKVENLLVTGSQIRWYDNAVGGTNLSSLTPLVNGNFYYASQSINSIESCARLAIRVIIGETSPPKEAPTQSICSGSLLSDLKVIGKNITWYDSEIGGSVLASSTELLNGRDYFASQTTDLCESRLRLKVTVSVNNNLTAPPSGLPVQSFCSGATVSKLIATGEQIRWYDSPSATNALNTNEPLEDQGIYYATQTTNSCESTTRLQVIAIVSSLSIPPPTEDADVKCVSVSTMYGSNLTLRSDGTLFGWGLNGFGQLGIGLSFPYHIFESPAQVKTDEPWISIGTGYFHSVGVKADGSMWAWGDNNRFQAGLLGDGKRVSKSLPIQVGIDKDWRYVSVGSEFSAAIKYDGTLWSWGQNTYGQLGDGTTTDKDVPVQVGKDTDWISVSLGLHHALALKSDGSLWSWGQNIVGALGDGTVESKNTPRKIGASGWKAVSAGAYRSFAIREDGTLWAWGSNDGGGLGDGTYLNRLIPVQVGKDSNWKLIASGLKYGHILAIKTDGTLWGWGENRFGQLGNGIFSGIPLITPNKIGNDSDWESVSVGFEHTIGVKKDGTLWQWGNIVIKYFINESFNTPQLVQISNAQAIQTFCEGASVGSLKVTGTGIRWYDSSTGGVALATTTPLTNGSHYFAEQSNGTCYSNSRLEVIVYLISNLPPNGSSSQVFCSNARISDLIVTGEEIKWYATATGGVPIPPSTPLVNGTRYYATQTANGCESSTRLEVLVNINNTPPPASSGSQTFCSGATVTNLAASGSNVKWYATRAGGSALSPTTALINGNRYYASQMLNSCESSDRIEVQVTVNSTATPSGIPNQSFCEGATLSSIAITGNAIRWYASATGGSVIAPFSRLANNTVYYASQTVNGCESPGRLAVTATITPAPAPPTGLTAQSLEEGKTISDILVTGTGVKWYASEVDAATRSNPLSGTMPLARGTSYYATQTVAGCESITWLTVSISLITSIEVKDHRLELYPNPVMDILNISYDAGIENVTVINMIGQTVVAKEVKHTSTSVDFSGLPVSTYLVRILSNGNVHQFKVLKK